jgi:hypothetical protein
MISIVLHEVDHGFMNLSEGRLNPLKIVNINKSIQIVYAKSDYNPITRRNLDFILGISWQTIGEMDPCSTGLLS